MGRSTERGEHDPGGTLGNVTIAASASQLTKTYGSGSAEVVALDAVDFDVHAGQFTAIMGPSGSGKSTLMHLMAALDTPTSGTVRIGETNVATLNDNALTVLRRERVGFIFQSFNLVPTLNAKENILLPLAVAGKKPDQAWFDQIIDVLGIGDRLTHKPAELSGGQQQRVACARALMNRPEIIFGDEPTGNLDSTSATEVLHFLRRSVDEFGQTVVIVTHDAGAASYADRAVFLSDGKIVEEMTEATQDDLLQAMARLYPRQSVPSRDEAGSQDSAGEAADQADQGSAEDQPAENGVADSHLAGQTEAAEADLGSDEIDVDEGLEALDEEADTRDEERLGLDAAEAATDLDEETDEYGVPVFEDDRVLFRDGSATAVRAGERVPETDLEISRPRRAIQD